MGEYFRGWYYRCQSDRQTLAVIASLHHTGNSKFCAIQLITDSQSFHIQLPYWDYQRLDQDICIAGCRFGKERLCLGIHSSGLHASGAVGFGPLTPIRYDIMGPFRYVPFLQCRHRIFSMRHTVNGTLSVNGTPYVFQNALGYMEGDRGYSFPRKYLWTQCSFPQGALMLSIADIPFGGIPFTGVIGIVLLNGKEYRLATYLGARAVKLSADEIAVRQGRFVLTVRPQGPLGHPLRAPVSGAMIRTIHEHPSCRVFYRLEEKGIPLLELDAPNAAMEYEY